MEADYCAFPSMDPRRGAQVRGHSIPATVIVRDSDTSGRSFIFFFSRADQSPRIVNGFSSRTQPGTIEPGTHVPGAMEPVTNPISDGKGAGAPSASAKVTLTLGLGDSQHGAQKYGLCWSWASLQGFWRQTPWPCTSARSAVVLGGCHSMVAFACFLPGPVLMRVPVPFCHLVRDLAWRTELCWDIQGRGYSCHHASPRSACRPPVSE